jgi:hypothetical protein
VLIFLTSLVCDLLVTVCREVGRPLFLTTIFGEKLKGPVARSVWALTFCLIARTMSRTRCIFCDSCHAPIPMLNNKKDPKVCKTFVKTLKYLKCAIEYKHQNFIKRGTSCAKFGDVPSFETTCPKSITRHHTI